MHMCSRRGIVALALRGDDCARAPWLIAPADSSCEGLSALADDAKLHSQLHAPQARVSSLLTCSSRSLPLSHHYLTAQHHDIYWSGRPQGAPSNAFGQRLLRSVPPLISTRLSPLPLSALLASVSRLVSSLHSPLCILSAPVFSTAFTVLVQHPIDQDTLWRLN